VVAQLNKLADVPGYAARCGEELRQWFLKTHSNTKWARVYDAILAGSSLGLLPSFDGTPLNAPCDLEERRYHDNERAAAPPFPNYF
jgi:hypothetical protein